MAHFIQGGGEAREGGVLNVNIVEGWLIAEGMKPRKSNYKEEGPGGPPQTCSVKNVTN